jgi:hypothetical protein
MKNTARRVLADAFALICDAQAHDFFEAYGEPNEVLSVLKQLDTRKYHLGILWNKSQKEPVCITLIKKVLYLTKVDGHIFLYQNCIYRVPSSYNVSEGSLLVLDLVDKERLHFERLKSRYNSGNKEELSIDRPRIPEKVRI